MARGPDNPKELFPGIIADYQRVFGDDLVSVILYGSAAGRDYVPGKSDINFMIVLSETGINDLDRAFETVRKWRKQRVAVPLFLTETYVETSLDVFPIEYLNFRQAYVVAFGKDILKDLVIDREFLRLQCEREIKGKLLLLRQAFLETGGRGRGLRELIGQSLSAFVAIFKALLHLRETEIPGGKKDVIRETCRAFQLKPDVFETVWGMRAGNIKLSDAGATRAFKDYLREVRRLAKQVDAMGE